MHIGHKIRELRKDRGISAKEFARLLDVKSRQCTYDFEKRESVTTDNLKKIAKILDVNIAVFYDNYIIPENEVRQSEDKDKSGYAKKLSYNELMEKYIAALEEISNLKDDIIELQKKLPQKNGYK